MNRMGHPKIDTQIYQLILIKVSELFHKESFIFNKWCQIVEYLCVKNRKKKDTIHTSNRYKNQFKRDHRPEWEA